MELDKQRPETIRTDIVRHTMNILTAGYLIIYGIFLILLGLMEYLPHPEKARTALTLGGGLGVLSVLWGVAGARSARWSRLAALFTTALLSLACIWRASVGWMNALNGHAESVFSSLIATLMLSVSAVMLLFLLKDRTSASADNPMEGLR